MDNINETKPNTGNLSAWGQRKNNTTDLEKQVLAATLEDVRRALDLVSKEIKNLWIEIEYLKEREREE